MRLLCLASGAASLVIRSAPVEKHDDGLKHEDLKHGADDDENLKHDVLKHKADDDENLKHDVLKHGADDDENLKHDVKAVEVKHDDRKEGEFIQLSPEDALESVEQEKAALLKERDSIDAELKQQGITELVQNSSPEKEMEKMHEDWQKAKVKGAEKSKELNEDPEKALEMVKDRFQDSEEGEQIEQTLAMVAGSGAGGADMYIKAMLALNKMFLAVDDERINLLTTCKNDLEMQWKMIWKHQDTLTSMDAAISGNFQSVKEKRKEWKGLHSQQKIKEKARDDTMSEQKTRMDGMVKDLEVLQADTNLYRFIMGIVEKNCTGMSVSERQKKQVPGSTGSTFMLAQTTEKEASEAEACADSKKDDNALILRIFSDPDVQAAVDKDLSWHEKHSLHTTMEHIREFEEEEVATKYHGAAPMFLQKPKAIPGWGEKMEGCACAGKPIDCNAMMTMVGQFLECAKQKEREQEAKINAQQKDDTEELDYQNGEIEALVSEKQEVRLAGDRYYQTARAYFPTRRKEIQKLRRFYMVNKDRRFECYMKFYELENNHFCAIMALRQFMKKATMSELKISPEKISDCDYGDFMRPTGQCSFGDQAANHLRGKTANCGGKDEDMPGIQMNVAEGKLPKGSDVPQQKWQRDMLSFQSPANIQEIKSAGLLGIMGNQTIALACPKTTELTLPCNMWMCPVHCEVSAWEDWGQCTASCDTGAETRSRSVIRQAKFGGDACPDTEDSRDCNTHPCNRDCWLHNSYTETTGCLSACSYGEAPRVELLRRKVFDMEKGTGTCPHKNDAVRAMEYPCPSRRCQGDEFCNDQMDMVIAYECSGSTTRLGCFFMAAFVVNLMDRMPTIAWGLTTMRIALVRFGNGIPVPVGDGTYVVAAAEQVTTKKVERGQLTTDASDLVIPMYNHVKTLWGKNSPWHLGFNNMGQALVLAQEILGTQDEEYQEAGQQKKVLLLTKGKQVECTIAITEAEKLKEKGVLIDAILFSSDYASNPDQYGAVEGKPAQGDSEPKDGVVSFPPAHHFYPSGPLYKFNSAGYRYKLARSLIPKICPSAVSYRVARRSQCKAASLILHRGRTCPNWSKPLKDAPVGLAECTREASARGFKGFVWKDTVSHYTVHEVKPSDQYSPVLPKGEASEAAEEAGIGGGGSSPVDVSVQGGSSSPNCLVHCDAKDLGDCKPENSRSMVEQVDAEMNPLDETCDYVIEAAKGTESENESKGWANMALSGVMQEESHYQVLASAADCGKMRYPFAWHTSQTKHAKGWWRNRPLFKVPAFRRSMYDNITNPAEKKQMAETGSQDKTTRGSKPEQ